MQTLRVGFRRDDHGATMVEYALLITLISLVLVTAILAMSGALSGLFGQAEDALTRDHPLP